MLYYRCTYTLKIRWYQKLELHNWYIAQHYEEDRLAIFKPGLW